jgi:hypothetical protein
MDHGAPVAEPESKNGAHLNVVAGPFGSVTRGRGTAARRPRCRSERVNQVGQDLERHPRPDRQGRLPDDLLHVPSNGGCPEQDARALSAISTSMPVLSPRTKARAVLPSGRVATAHHPCARAATDVRPTEATAGSV